MRFILSLGLLAACGGTDPFEPGGGDDPGSGTATLVVNGSATAQPRLANALQPGDFDTEFNVRVSLNNVPITTGTVTMKSATTTVDLIYEPNGNNGNGSWRGTGGGYDEVYQLDVVSGPDAVHGVRVDGPDVHSFSAPLAGAVVDSTLALAIAWDRGETADAALLYAGDNGNGNGITIADSGTYSLAPATLRSEKDQSRPNTIRLRRSNRVTPVGAAGGSELAVSVENEVDVVAQPNPNAP
ncbi:MAG: hypothetical protein NT062_38285 [Proteobacteria bacterium]|nr:hypothetical protein [Pseudomonadota bacterium]